MKFINLNILVLICSLTLCSCGDTPEEADITIRRLKEAYPNLVVDKLTSNRGYVARDTVSGRVFYFCSTLGSYHDDPGAPSHMKEAVTVFYDWQEVTCEPPKMHEQSLYLEELVRYLGPPASELSKP